MPYGYHGRVLHVNLTAGSITVEEPDERFYRRYMGGSAMGLYYLLKNTPPGTDPLAPENTLALMVSPLTGVPISGQSRMTATTRSPLNGMVGDSQCGGFWPAEFKFTGFDGVVMTDSLSAAAVTEGRSIEEAVSQAIVAGADIALWDQLAEAKSVHKELSKAVASGRLSEDQVNASVTRVLDLKGVDLCEGR